MKYIIAALTLFFGTTWAVLPKRITEIQYWHTKSNLIWLSYFCEYRNGSGIVSKIELPNKRVLYQSRGLQISSSESDQSNWLKSRKLFEHKFPSPYQIRYILISE